MSGVQTAVEALRAVLSPDAVTVKPGPDTAPSGAIGSDGLVVVVNDPVRRHVSGRGNFSTAHTHMVIVSYQNGAYEWAAWRRNYSDHVPQGLDLYQADYGDLDALCAYAAAWERLAV